MAAEAPSHAAGLGGVPRSDAAMRWMISGVIAFIVCGACASAADGPVPSPFAGVVLSDHLGSEHDLALEARSALVMLFRVDDRVGAKEWDDGLRQRLAGHALVPVIDAVGIAVEDRPKLIEKATRKSEGKVLFLLDWDGVVRTRLLAVGLAAKARGVVIAGFVPEGAFAGVLAGEPTAANRTLALRWIGIVPDPPLVDAGAGP